MNKRLLSLTALLLLSLPLVACQKTDTDVVVDFMNEWMKERGVLDENGKPTVKAGLVATGFGTTDDPVVDAAVQGGMVVKDMNDMDAIVKKAGQDLARSDTKAALEKMNVAINARPNDWAYRNRRATVYTEMGDTKAAEKDFQAARDGCDGNTRCLTLVEKDRKNLLQKPDMGL